MEVSAGLFPPEASLLLQVAAFSLCPSVCAFLAVHFFCVHMESLFSDISTSSYKDNSPIGLGPHPYDCI